MIVAVGTRDVGLLGSNISLWQVAKGRGGTKTHAGRAAATTGCPGQGGARPEGDPGGEDRGRGQGSW